MKHSLPTIDAARLPAAGVVQNAVGLILAAVAFLGVGGLATAKLVDIDIGVDATGVLEPMRTWVVRARESGLITSVGVREGDSVRVGDTLLVMDSLPHLGDLLRVEADREQLRIEYRLAVTSAPLEMQRLVGAVAQARARMIRARASLRDRLTALGVGSDVDSLLAAYVPGKQVLVDLAVSDILTAEAELEAREAEVGLLEAGALNLEKQRAQLRRLEVQVAALRERLGRLVLTAPQDGVVLTEEPYQLLGRHAGEGDPLLEIADPLRWRAVLRLSERDVHRVAVGDPVKITLPAFAGLGQDLLDGTLASVASTPAGGMGANGSSGGLYTAVVELEPGSVEVVGASKLRRGYAVRAEVITRSGPILDQLIAFLAERMEAIR